MVAVSGLGAGCEDKHIGRPCDLGVQNPDAGSSGTTATITSPALECPSRICLLPAATKNPGGTGPLCTAECDSNEDCEDGETGGQGSALCKTGFVCMWPTTVGGFCCRKMCACRDFVTEPPGGFQRPQVCTSAEFGCRNVQ
jgi:hypothetical protein